ncbi:MAG TPA: rhodanese-like domain-containing protein [Micropepsaceae bacterium]|nr:rhodanese-like domain-containing protein [Micropepsaceae bacterium]
MTGGKRSEAVSSNAGYAGDLSPRESWDRMSGDGAAQLVDVRTGAEWNFVGVPDLSGLGREALLCEWQHFPSSPNPAFVQQVTEALKRTSYRPGAALFFLCRSGARSRAAAIAMTKAGYGPCFNVSDGFEGGLNEERHRGSDGGWKASGLPWGQS